MRAMGDRILFSAWMIFGSMWGIAACILLAGCSASQQTQAVAGGEQLAACVIPIVAMDVMRGDSWEMCVADAVGRCGATAIQVSTIWAAHNRGLVLEGYVPKMPVPVGGP